MRTTDRLTWRLLAIGGVLLASLGLSPARPPAPARPAADRPAARVPQHHVVVNPHLHLRSATGRAGERAIQEHRHTTVVVVRHHTTHWHYNEWARVHRTTGTVVGRVVDASGRAVAGAGVWLRRPGGAPFRRASMKHAVHTGPGGGFVMRGVRAGAYRVRAHVGKPAVATSVVVHGGRASTVELRL